MTMGAEGVWKTSLALEYSAIMGSARYWLRAYIDLTSSSGLPSILRTIAVRLGAHAFGDTAEATARKVSAFTYS